MYGPSLEGSSAKQPTLVTSVNDEDFAPTEFMTVSRASSDRAVSLEQVELEILLSMKIENGQSFEKAVQATMACSGNEFLFTFPSDRFPIACINVACIRMLNSEMSDGVIVYLFQQEEAGSIQIADPDELTEEFEQFAHSFIAVMEQMRDMLAGQQTH